MTEQRLRSFYHLTDVSTKVNPYTFTKKEEIKLSPFMDYNFPDRPSSSVVDPFHYASSNFKHYYEERKKILTKQQCAAILFDEMRALSKPFALYGIYSPLIVRMINHLQNNSGTVFRDTLLNMALKDQISHDFSGSSSLRRIKFFLIGNIDWKAKVLHEESRALLTSEISFGKVPKFNRLKDKMNGMGITIHDTYATQITLKSLLITDSGFEACINYKIQDHFGLDKEDIMKGEYNILRFFRIWFILQRYEKLAFRPFVTEMETDIFLKGGRI